MTMLKLIRIGNSVGVVLPKDILSRLNLEAGDALYLSESPDGYRLSRYDPAFERQTEVARKVTNRRQGALRELAK